MLSAAPAPVCDAAFAPVICAPTAEAGAHDGGGGDSGVAPRFPVSGTDRGWAFAHVALLSLWLFGPAIPRSALGLPGRGRSVRTGRTQEQKLA